MTSQFSYCNCYLRFGLVGNVVG